MAPIAQKVAISAAEKGLVLRPTGPKGSFKDVQIEYGTNKISTIPHRPAADTSTEEVSGHGIVGLLDLVSSAHLIVITKRERVAQIRGKDIWAVRDVALVSLEGKGEAEKGLAAARKSVGTGTEEPDDAAEMEGESSDVEVSEDEDEGKGVGGSTDEEGKPVEAEAFEAPKQGLLRKGTGVAKGVVTSPIKVGRFAGKWFGRGGGAAKAKPAEVEGEGAQNELTSGAQQDEIIANDAKDKQPEPTEPIAKVAEPKEVEQKDHSQSVIESLTPRILRGARLYFASSGFCFSYEHDISGALTQKSDMAGGTPLWKRFDPMFFWNRHLLGPFIDAGLDELALPLLQGFVGQRAFSIQKTEQGENDVVTEAAQKPDEVIAAQATPAPNVQVRDDGKESREFLLTMISRRSTKRAGLRYRRRGIDDEGNVANFVETEQILSTQAWNSKDKAFSLLQIRGSIPLFFNQSPYSFKPQPIPFGSEATNHAAFTKHFESLNKRYGEVQIASLVDKGATEVGIGELFGKHVQMANNGDGIRGSQIGFEWFDFHKQCSGMRFENVSILLDTLKSKLESFGWIVKQKDQNSRLQKGILKTNCMDCLDRSNVTQSAVAGWALEKQLAELGLQIDLKKDPKTQWFNTLWADNGDYISKQYAGTAALKGDFTRTRKRNWTGALSDFSLSLTRYYNNIFGDYFLQACIDYYLGNVGPQVFEEFEADMMSQDYALDMRRIRKNGIETCVKIVLEDPKEVLKAGWTLSCPKEPNTLRTLPFEECVLLLTDQGLYFCRFDWDTEKVASFERVDLRDLVEIWRGAYITNALGPTHLDEEKNVGFAVRYKTSKRAIVRRNTRSLRNEEEAEDENAGKDELQKQEQPEIDETRMLAFKALPPQASASKGQVEEMAVSSEGELVTRICSEVYLTMAALRLTEGENQDDLPGNKESDVISAAEAKKATGYMESIGYSLKRLIRIPRSLQCEIAPNKKKKKATKATKATKQTKDDSKIKEYKPLKILSARKRITASAKVTLLANASQSKFLNLPPEVRNRIYRLFLGDRLVHVEIGHVYPCHAHQSDREAAEQAIKSGREVGFKTWQGNHKHCLGLDDDSVLIRRTLPLLRVCRQVHSEASLLPFATNTFIFDSPTHINSFAERLVLEQRKAINSIAIATKSQSIALPAATKQAMAKFACLRHFTLLVELKCRLFDPGQLQDSVPKHLEAATQLLKYVEWETVVVCVTSKRSRNYRDVRIVSPGDFQAESRKMEQVLLEPWDAAKEMQRKAVEQSAMRKQEEIQAKAVLEAKVQASNVMRGHREAARTRQGLRKVKVASSGAWSWR